MNGIRNPVTAEEFLVSVNHACEMVAKYILTDYGHSLVASGQ